MVSSDGLHNYDWTIEQGQNLLTIAAIAMDCLCVFNKPSVAREMDIENNSATQNQMNMMCQIDSLMIVCNGSKRQGLDLSPNIKLASLQGQRQHSLPDLSFKAKLRECYMQRSKAGKIDARYLAGYPLTLQLLLKSRHTLSPLQILEYGTALFVMSRHELDRHMMSTTIDVRGQHSTYQVCRAACLRPNRICD